MDKIGVALIGCGGIALANHLPGFKLCPQAEVIALCDSNPLVLAKASLETGITNAFSNYEEVLQQSDVHAVVIATPNYLHAPITLAAVANGKHVLCEKPLAMNYEEALTMWHAAENANVRHMTAFTYRFVPAMRYMAHLVQQGAVGQPYHFRANRFQDWGQRYLGWRQVKRFAATGELGDMLSHRIDYGHLLVGSISRVIAHTRRFVDEREGHAAELEDWVAMLAEFTVGATGVFESTKLATGRGEGGRSQDYCELNGSDGTLIYFLNRPHQLQIGRKGSGELETIAVPEKFLKIAGSPRELHTGDPLANFRYDQDFEFIDAILNERPCQPSFYDGARTQAVIEAALASTRAKTWTGVSGADIPNPY